MCNLEERKQVELDKIINIYLGNIKNFTKQGNILFFNKIDYTYSQLKGILKGSEKRVNEYIKNTYGEKFIKGWAELKNFKDFYEVHFKFPKLLSDAYEVKENISSYKEKFNEIPSVSLEDENDLSYFDEVGDYKVKYQQNNKEGIIASEKTIRDLAARMSDRIGIPFKIESDRTKEYKGKLKNYIAYINLAYVTLDTPIHEILGHPIIRAIKSNNPQLYQNLLKELEYGKGKEVLDRIKRDYNKKFERGKSFTFEGKDYIADTASKTGYRDKYGDDVHSNELETALFAYELKHKDKVYYTLEEQQEEAIVELMSLMVAEKLNPITDKNLISLLKQLLKQINDFIKSLLTTKELNINDIEADNVKFLIENKLKELIKNGTIKKEC